MDLSLQILLFVALLILLAKAVGGLSGRMGFPVVLGELMAGVILGPTLLDVWRLPWFAAGAHSGAAAALSLPAVVRILAQLGVVVLMFLAGLETDIEMMKDSVGPAFWSACGGVVLPLVGGAALARAVGFSWTEAVFIGTVLTATSVSITAQTLMNLGRLRTKVGSTILGAAVIDDVLGLMVLSFVVAAEGNSGSMHSSGWAGIGMTLVRAVVFLGLSFWLGPPLMRKLFDRHDRFREPHTSVAVALGTCFIFAFLAEYGGGMAAITGSYLAGLFMTMTAGRERLLVDLRAMSNSFFAPLFFVSIGLEINARELGGQFGFFTLLFVLAAAGKVLGCGVGAWFKGMKVRDSVAVGVGMIPRGEVGLITASIGWATGVIGGPVYSLLVIVVLATTLITPVLLRLALPHEPVVAPVVESAALAADMAGES
jgi:Kef-type K+ transport system membrane component KefB